MKQHLHFALILPWRMFSAHRRVYQSHDKIFQSCERERKRCRCPTYRRQRRCHQWSKWRTTNLLDKFGRCCTESEEGRSSTREEITHRHCKNSASNMLWIGRTKYVCFGTFTSRLYRDWAAWHLSLPDLKDRSEVQIYGQFQRSFVERRCLDPSRRSSLWRWSRHLRSFQNSFVPLRCSWILIDKNNQ